MHLQDSGIPKVGVEIKPGMIIVGKIGKTKYFDARRQPNALEIHGLTFEELRDRFGRMWRDNSFYAAPEICGKVINARVECVEGKLRAIVELTLG
jgi:DNA-directed RNA polymerase beta subunit